jgi:hypothetical protein
MSVVNSDIACLEKINVIMLINKIMGNPTIAESFNDKNILFSFPAPKFCATTVDTATDIPNEGIIKKLKSLVTIPNAARVTVPSELTIEVSIKTFIERAIITFFKYPLEYYLPLSSGFGKRNCLKNFLKL